MIGRGIGEGIDTGRYRALEVPGGIDTLTPKTPVRIRVDNGRIVQGVYSESMASRGHAALVISDPETAMLGTADADTIPIDAVSSLEVARPAGKYRDFGTFFGACIDAAVLVGVTATVRSIGESNGS